MSKSQPDCIYFDLKDLDRGPDGIASDTRELMRALAEHSSLKTAGIIFPHIDIGINFDASERLDGQSLRLSRAVHTIRIPVLGETILNSIGTRFFGGFAIGSFLSRLFTAFYSLFAAFYSWLGSKIRRKNVELYPIDPILNRSIFYWLFQIDLGLSATKIFDKSRFFIGNWSKVSLNCFTRRQINRKKIKDLTIELPDKSTLWLSSPMPIKQNNNRRYIIRFHDAFPMLYPNWSQKEFTRRFVASTRSLVANNSLFFCNSETVCQQLLTCFPELKDRVKLVYCPINQPAELFRADEFKPYLSSLGLTPGEYIVTVSSSEYRKNLAGLFDIFSMLKIHRPDLKLLYIRPSSLQPPKPKADQPPIELKISAMREEGSIIEIQNISKCVLNSLIHQSALYLSAAIAEGFGKGVIEAQICGVPVVAPDIPIFCEILGKSALLYHNFNYREAVELCRSILDDEAKRKEFISLGYENAKRFSAQSVATQIQNILSEYKW